MVRMCQDAAFANNAQEEPPTASTSSNNVKATSVADLVKSLRVVTAPMDTQAPVVITADKTVPPVIVADDLKIFRCALILMTHAVKQTTEGMICYTIRVVRDRVIFECADTGHNIPVEERGTLFQPKHANQGCGAVPVQGDSAVFQPCSGSKGDDLCDSLSTVALLVDSMTDGRYGFRPSDAQTPMGGRWSGSVFWFSIPLTFPKESSGYSSQRNSDDLFSRKRTHASL